MNVTLYIVVLQKSPVSIFCIYIDPTESKCTTDPPSTTHSRYAASDCLYHLASRDWGGSVGEVAPIYYLEKADVDVNNDNKSWRGQGAQFEIFT